MRISVFSSALLVLFLTFSITAYSGDSAYSTKFTEESDLKLFIEYESDINAVLEPYQLENISYKIVDDILFISKDEYYDTNFHNEYEELGKWSSTKYKLSADIIVCNNQVAILIDDAFFQEMNSFVDLGILTVGHRGPSMYDGVRHRGTSRDEANRNHARRIYQEQRNEANRRDLENAKKVGRAATRSGAAAYAGSRSGKVAAIAAVTGAVGKIVELILWD